MTGFTHRLMASVALALATPAACILPLAPSVAAAQTPAELINFDIPSLPLADALNAFSKQAGVQILFPYDVVSGRTSEALHGRLSRQDALARLIAGSGLELVGDDGHTVTLRAVHGRAADAAPAGSGEGPHTVNEVVVTASARRNEQAIAVHRQALGVADAVTQDDTGDLADQTVADALIRLPGISTMQTLYGEQSAKYVSVRGISPDLNAVTFDGIGLYSASNDGSGTRRVDLQLIPTQVSRTTEVFKSFAPDLDAGVIGGLTNMVPYSALDGQSQAYLDATVEYRPSSPRVPGFNSLGGYLDTPWGGGLKGLYVHRFGPSDQFGIVASVVYNQESWTASKPNNNGLTYYTAAGATAKSDLSNWNGLAPMPTLARPLNYTKLRRLFGGYVGFEYRATDALKLSASVYDYLQTEDQSLSDFYVESFTAPKYSTPTVATLKIGRYRPIFDYDLFKTESRGVILKGVQDFGGGNVLEVRGAYGLSQFYDMDQGFAYAYSPTSDSITWDVSQPYRSFTLSNPTGMLDTSKYTMYSASDMYSRTAFNAYEGRADFKHNFSAGSEGFGLAVGADARTVNAKRDINQIDYAPAGKLGSLGSVPDFNAFQFSYPTIFLDARDFNSQVKPGLAVNKASTNNDSLSSDYEYDETILAAYATGMYAINKTRLIAGFRFENTDYTAYVPQSKAGTYIGVFTQYKGSYQHILPSVSLIQDLREDLKLKASYSETLGRPAFSDIAQAEVRNDSALTISRGNPDLKPRDSNNYDLAAEYYFNGRDGMVSVAGFYKNIKNDIYSLSSTQDIDGTQYTVTTPQNASNSSIKGVEVQFIDNRIASLPGFLHDRLGVSINVTRMWGQMNYLVSGAPQQRNGLLYQPNWLANGQLFYKLPRDGEIRLAYNWADKSLNTVNAQIWNDYVLQARGQMNASFRFPLRPNLILKIEGDNLLGENTSMMHGYYWQRYTLTQDRTFFLDIVWKH